MSKPRVSIISIASFLILAACGGADGTRANDAACAVTVLKTLDMLPDDMSVHVEKIESGRSGNALSCKVTGPGDNIMIDATVTCSGGADELDACITIDGISTLNGEIIYPADLPDTETEN
ncbi:hypothetical protein WNY37_07060 [Henriciella sp. AS95]|uniref:hypothetical protein n=1 Tax=Henriciella sp. AS95 TaxID=3135782 RepID=UPI00316CC54E